MVSVAGRSGDRPPTVVCERCLLATTPWRRLRGLLGRRELPPGEGIVIRPSNSIHMFFMRFAIDAVFLDADDVVLDVAPSVRPWRIAARKGAKSVLELADGEASRRGISAGMRLSFEGGAA